MSDENSPQLKQLLETAQRVQQDINQVQQQLARKQVEGSAGGGMVKVVVNGQQQVISVRMEPQVVDPQEVEMLQDLVVAATNAALTKAARLAQDEMSKITGGMNLKIPGLTQ